MQKLTIFLSMILFSQVSIANLATCASDQEGLDFDSTFFFLEYAKYRCDFSGQKKNVEIKGVGLGLYASNQMALLTCAAPAKTFYGVGVRAKSSVLVGLSEGVYLGTGVCNFGTMGLGLGASGSLGVMTY